MSTRINLWAADHGSSHDRGGQDEVLPGLQNLISGRLPTLTGWDSDPTDSANIIDGNIATFCTTGSKTAGGGYQYGWFEWDLGELYHVLTSFVGYVATSAGQGYVYVQFWNGTAWVSIPDAITNASSVRHVPSYSGYCSKVRIGICASVAATITPNIREFAVWRL